MIWVLVMALSGASLGVLLAPAYVPRVRTLPTVAGFVIIACLIVWPGFQMNQELSLWVSLAAPMAFILSITTAGSLYAASLWVKIFPEAQLSYWQFAARDFTSPRFLRQQYAAMLAEREEQRAVWNYRTSAEDD